MAKSLKITILILSLVLGICFSIQAVSYYERDELYLFPDSVSSGTELCIGFDPIKREVFLAFTSNSDTNIQLDKTTLTLLLKGNKTGEATFDYKKGLDYDSFVEVFEKNTEVYLVFIATNQCVSKESFLEIDNLDFSTRLNKILSAEYRIGDTGPAGGVVFFDKGYYSDGWRYLEAAPADLRIVFGSPSVDASSTWYDFGEATILFGYYQINNGSTNAYVNGTKSYDRSNCTRTAIGCGKKNTELLVNAMKNQAYTSFFTGTSDTTSSYAASQCFDLVFNGFDDWFLPSKDELNLIYTNLKVEGFSTFSEGYYWSSSEDGDSSSYVRVWTQDFLKGSQISFLYSRDMNLFVRPIRAF